MRDDDVDYGKAVELLEDAEDRLRDAFGLLGHDVSFQVDETLDLWGVANLVEDFAFEARGYIR